MAPMSKSNSKHMYSWWWDSHNTPKNSKWLQENLTDMDSKVKQMIKLIEEDADSFARRAEMYYKKRPELMKLVEEFYRAYRALAERYDNATGVLKQAQRTMAEAFPNQVPFVMGDELPAGSAIDPRTPDLPPPLRALVYPDELHKDALGFSSSPNAFNSNETFNEDNDDEGGRKGLRKLNNTFGSGEAVIHSKFVGGKSRKGLKFLNDEEKEQGMHNNGLADLEVLSLKNALTKLEAEKEASEHQYQQTLERLSKLEAEFSCIKEDSQELNEQANRAQVEAQTLKEVLTKLEAEKEASLGQYQQSLSKITHLENSIVDAQKDAGELTQRVRGAEMEAESLKQNLSTVEAEKDDALAEYNKCLEIISNLEEKLLHAEEDARMFHQQAAKAEHEVETLNQEISRLNEEKENAALQCRQYLEQISNMEYQLTCAQEVTQRLKEEKDSGVLKLGGSEERCILLETSNKTMHSELKSAVQKMISQGEELTEKQKEFAKLSCSVLEERLRYVEAEKAFQALQHLHSQSQEELRLLGADLQNRSHILKEMENLNHGLQDDVQRVKEEYKGLNELNLAKAASIENLQVEISSLRETIRQLEGEVKLRADEKKALQQEIYCLKEELNNLNKKYQAMTEQVESAGFNTECFGSSAKELQDENAHLKEIREKDKNEKLALLGKMEIMEKLKERNAALENSLSDLNVDLEGIRGKVKALEESCGSLLGDKSTLTSENAIVLSQLQIANEHSEKLLEKNEILEISFFDANTELHGLRMNFNNSEQSCMLLNDEKTALITENASLSSQLDIAEKRLETLEKSNTELEARCSAVEKERGCMLLTLQGLQESLDAKRQEHKEMSEDLRLKIIEGNQREEDLRLQLQQLQAQSLELENARLTLQKKYQMVLDDRRLLTKEVLNLGDEKQNLELGICDSFSETVSQNLLALILGEIVSEKYVQTVELIDSLSALHAINNKQEQKISVMTGMLEDMKLKNLRLNESLEKSDNELVLVRSVNENLNHEIARGKDLLCWKESEIFKAADMITSLRNEKSELDKTLEDLKRKYDDIEVLREDQEKQIIILSGDCATQKQDIGYLGQENQKLDDQLSKLGKEMECNRSREGILIHRLKEMEKEVTLWESEVGVSFSELQISAVREVLFEGKIIELIRVIETLEGTCDFKHIVIDQLNERVNTLESENRMLKDQLAAYYPAVISLRDDLTSLESHTLSRTSPLMVSNEEAKDAELASKLLPESGEEANEDQIPRVLDGCLELQKLQLKIKPILNAVVEMERLALLENSNANSKLEAAIKDIEELKLGSSLLKESFQESRSANTKLRSRRSVSEISEEGMTTMTKDIVLDQISASSSYRISKKGSVKADDEKLEVWETTNREGNINLNVGKLSKHHSRRHPSTESFNAKELGGVDKEISQRFIEYVEGGNNIKVLQRLDSDSQKLANLQITVQDLKKVVAMAEKSKKGKGIEFDTVKDQLDEADEAIVTLFDVNHKLMKKVEDSSFSFDEKSGSEIDPNASFRRSIPVQAKKVSEKIGRLQLEVQKLQFLLLKLDDHKDSTKKTKTTERRKRVLLRDYLYGGTSRSTPRKKKTSFCSCVQPPTKGD